MIRRNILEIFNKIVLKQLDYNVYELIISVSSEKCGKVLYFHRKVLRSYI